MWMHSERSLLHYTEQDRDYEEYTSTLPTTPSPEGTEQTSYGRSTVPAHFSTDWPHGALAIEVQKERGMVYETALHGLFYTHGTITKGVSRATRSTTPLRFSLA